MTRLSEADLKAMLRKRGYRVRVHDGNPSDAAKELKRHVAESKLEIRFAQQLAEREIFPMDSSQPALNAIVTPRSGLIAACEERRNPFPYVRNYLDAISGRNFELDFCWPRLRFAVEIDGMAHRTKGRFVADHEKHAILLLADWKILRVCGADIRNGRAVDWTMEVLRRAVGHGG